MRMYGRLHSGNAPRASPRSWNRRASRFGARGCRRGFPAEWSFHEAALFAAVCRLGHVPVRRFRRRPRASPRCRRRAALPSPESRTSKGIISLERRRVIHRMDPAPTARPRLRQRRRRARAWRFCTPCPLRPSGPCMARAHGGSRSATAAPCRPHAGGRGVEVCGFRYAALGAGPGRQRAEPLCAPPGCRGRPESPAGPGCCIRATNTMEMSFNHRMRLRIARSRRQTPAPSLVSREASRSTLRLRPGDDSTNNLEMP